MSVEIEKITSDGIRYISKVWCIKEKIRKENNLLKQKKKFFRHTYSKSVKYILKKDDQIIGFSAVNDKYISLLGIDPDFQGLGYGSELLDNIKSDKDELSCHTRISNENALNFYLSRGFGVDKTIDSYYCDGEDAYYLKYKK